jgi:hypothetical protein
MSVKNGGRVHAENNVRRRDRETVIRSCCSPRWNQYAFVRVHDKHDWVVLGDCPPLDRWTLDAGRLLRSDHAKVADAMVVGASYVIRHN